MKNKTLIAIGAGAILLVAATAGASVYMMDKPIEENAKATTTATSTPKAPVKENIVYNQPTSAQPAPVQQAQVPTCDDGNIVGKVVGGAAGGVAGSQFGKGNGKTAATIGGVVGGVLLGEEYIPTNNATCR